MVTPQKIRRQRLWMALWAIFFSGLGLALGLVSFFLWMTSGW